MEQRICDPVIPYVGPIHEDFSPRKMVRIQGSVPVTSYRFAINLQCGPITAPRDDVAFHISVGILEGFVVTNSLERGIWGDEQKETLRPSSFARGQKFEVLIFCGPLDLKVAINGQHFCEFPHRIPYHRISHLAIDGDVSIVQITYETQLSGNQGGNEERNHTYRFNQPVSADAMPPPSYDMAVSGGDVGKSYNTAPSVGFTGPPYSYSAPPDQYRQNLIGQCNLPEIPAPLPSTVQPTIVYQRSAVKKYFLCAVGAGLLIAVFTVAYFLKKAKHSI